MNYNGFEDGEVVDDLEDDYEEDYDDGECVDDEPSADKKRYIGNARSPMSLFGRLIVAVLVVHLIHFYVYAGVRLEVKTKYIPLEKSMSQAVEEIEERDDLVFVEEDTYDTYKGSMVYQFPVSYWNLLSPEEQEESLQRAYATDAYYLELISKTDEIMAKYKKYLNKPERAFSKDKLVPQLQEDIAILTPIVDEFLLKFDKCDPDEKWIYIWPDSVCIGDYLGMYRRNEWVPNGPTSLEDERDYYTFTYDYGEWAEAYVGHSLGILREMEDLASARIFPDGRSNFLNKTSEVRFVYGSYAEAQESVCEARAYMYLQMGINPEDITAKYLQQQGYRINY